MRLTERVFKLEKDKAHKAGHRIDTLEEKVAELGEDNAGHWRMSTQEFDELKRRISVLEARTAATRETIELAPRKRSWLPDEVIQRARLQGRARDSDHGLEVYCPKDGWMLAGGWQAGDGPPPGALLCGRCGAVLDDAAGPDPTAEAIEQREVDRSREMVEGASCFVCGQVLGPALGEHEAGVGWRHIMGSALCKQRMPRLLVLVESPFKGGGAREHYADAAMLDSLGKGEAPMLSHLLYTRVLDDDTPTDRHTGMSAGWAWLRVVDRLVVYTDLGISDGMKAGIRRAEAQKVEIEHRTIPGWKARP